MPRSKSGRDVRSEGAGRNGAVYGSSDGVVGRQITGVAQIRQPPGMSAILARI